MKLLFEIFITFLKIGTFTFGGGLAMLPMFRKAVAEEKGWMTEEEITDCLAISQSLPGMLALNAAIYIGKKKGGFAGSIAASLGVILPAFISIIVILLFLGRVEDNPYVNGVFEGIKAASAALIAVSAYQMGRQILKGRMEIFIAVIAFVLIVFVKISAVWTIVLGGFIGLCSFWYRQRKGGAA